MTRYLFVQSRDPFETAAVGDDHALAAALAARGHEVRLLLLQNGVLAARRDARTDVFEESIRRGVELLAEEFSLRERGIDATELRDGISPAPLEVVIDEMAAGAKTTWF